MGGVFAGEVVVVGYGVCVDVLEGLQFVAQLESGLCHDGKLKVATRLARATRNSDKYSHACVTLCHKFSKTLVYSSVASVFSALSR